MLEKFGTPLQQLVNLVHPLVNDWGVALVLCALVLRLCVLPLTLKQRRTALLFAQLRPSLERIRAEHTDNREAAMQAQMNFIRSQNYDPRPGCWASVLEAMFLITVFGAVSRWPALNMQPAFGADDWIPNLLQPDRAVNFGRTVVLIGRHLHVLPFVWLGVVALRMVIPFTRPANSEQLRSQLGMPIVIGVFAYHASAALWLLVLPWVLVSEVERSIIRGTKTPDVIIT